MTTTTDRTTREDAAGPTRRDALRLRPGASVALRDLAGTAASFALILALVLGLAPGAAHGPGTAESPSAAMASLAR